MADLTAQTAGIVMKEELWDTLENNISTSQFSKHFKFSACNLHGLNVSLLYGLFKHLFHGLHLQSSSHPVLRSKGFMSQFERKAFSI